ncbi:hypothetical protein Q4577_14910 [Marinovum sp. 2_MG-2023]|uniref:hypothetical protein n=1 Tax=unclassified Marinovum TaxID=2647166 RepID=UPI0026E3C601|nr:MULTISPECIES: hypothetical protein [unclassified Marinovum]MDO6731320.1 hypothetical protein [Marinovum sp. 2_MG-2023]MDO6780781.1 hypothetical protein [Marinovum sp. 1_MG-2023]
MGATMHLIRLCLCLVPLTLVLGCTQFPALDNSEGPDVAAAAYPRLLSIEELRAIPDSTTTLEVQTSLLGRLAALRARAAGLQSPVIDRATRSRMARGVR